MTPVSIIASLTLALAAVETTAYWWMHPAPAGLGQPVLVYQPGTRDQRSEIGDQVAPFPHHPASTISGPQSASPSTSLDSSSNSSSLADPSSSLVDPSSSPIDPSSSLIDPSSSLIGPSSSLIGPSSSLIGPSSSLIDPSSSLVDPSSSLIDPSSSLIDPSSSLIDPSSSLIDPSSSLIDPSSSSTPLPAVVEKAMPSLRCSTGTAARIDRADGVTVHVAFFEWDLADSTNVLEAFKHLPEECMGSIGMTLTSHQPARSYQIGAETLWFDHTVFRDAAGITVHAFKGTWVSGASSLIGNGYRGGADQWNQLRWKSALKRFHPAYARVAQGAVRGIPNPDLAWATFEDSMLKDLTFQ